MKAHKLFRNCCSPGEGVLPYNGLYEGGAASEGMPFPFSLGLEVNERVGISQAENTEHGRENC